jgi:hypothetical protein
MNNLKPLLTLSVKLFSVVLVFLFINSCMKEDINMDKISKTTQLNGTIAIPMVSGELTMKDIIEAQDSFSMVKQYYSGQNSGLLYLLYRSDLLSEKAEDFVLIKDQNFLKSVTGLPSSTPLPITIYDTTYYDFGVTNGEQIDSIFLKGGTLTLNVKSTFHNLGSVVLKIPNLVKNGSPLQIDVPIDVANGTFNSTISPKDLSGYKFKVFEKNSYNKVKIVYLVTLQSGTALAPSYAITFTSAITKLKFSKLYGYIGSRQLIDNIGKISMNIFDVKGQSYIDFNNPQINLITQNSFGVPIKIDYHDLNTTSNLTSVPFALNFSSPVYFKAAPSFTASYDTTLKYNKGNSNILLAIATSPKDLNYGVKVTVNPKGKEAQNFVADTSKFRAALEVELPMELKADRYEYNKTIDFDMSSDISDFSIFKKLAIYNKMENWFPFEARFQLILTDDKLVAIDTLYTYDKQPIIKAGTINALGRVDAPKTYNDSVIFSNDRILKFKDVKKAIIKIALYTKDYDKKTYVKFYATDKIKISLGVRAEINVKSTDQLKN